ncbi:MAG: hypothetical protein R3C05_17675 [Pirellulaceae bacterium]
MLRILCIQLSLFLAITLPTATRAAGPVDEPYAVYVAGDAGFARCGPSREHYKTDELSEGDVLEVYIETEDGWLGIRPPETSFCWLPADQVSVDDEESVGKVIDAEAVAWIGTNLGQARQYRWQVQLELGEAVAIIGHSDRETRTGEMERWYRIVPPAGEFRWVHKDQVVTSREALARVRQSREAERLSKVAASQQRASDTNDRSTLQKQTQPAAFDSAAARREVAQDGDVLVERESDGVRQAPIARVSHEAERSSSAMRSRLSLNDNIRVRESTSQHPVGSGLEANHSADSPREASHPASNWTQAIRSAPSPGPSSMDATSRETTFAYDNVIDTQASLERMQLQFAGLMASEASAQQAEQLKQNVRAWVDSTNDPEKRRRGELLILRIEKYQQISRERNSAPQSTQVNSDVTNSILEQNANSQSFDREGTLVKVYSARPDAPPYALTDRNGQTVAYVSPPFGTNAHRLLNQHVGISGKLSPNADSDIPHFIAQKMVRIPGRF